MMRWNDERGRRALTSQENDEGGTTKDELKSGSEKQGAKNIRTKRGDINDSACDTINVSGHGFSR